MDIKHLTPKNPILAVGALVFHSDRVLLVRRNNPPNQGLWSIPGGKVELGESLQAAAEREIWEETRIEIRAKTPIFCFDTIERDAEGNVRFHYVIIDLIAEYVSGEAAPGDDANDAMWFSKTDLTHSCLSEMTRQLLSDQFNFGGQVE